MNTNETQDNDKQTEQKNDLADLEPQAEVKAGGGIVSEGQGYGIQVNSKLSK